MKLPIINGSGLLQTFTVTGFATPVDHSGALAARTAKDVLDANADRGGWLFQNCSEFAMTINELGSAADGGWTVPAGDFFPPVGFPLTLGAISAYCVAPDGLDEGVLAYTLREWVD